MGIVFSLAEVSLASGWGSDRAVLGIWSGRWFRVPEALQAQKINYKQEEEDPRATPGQCSQVIMHRWLVCSSVSLSLLRQISWGAWQEDALWMCAVFIDHEPLPVAFSAS